MQAANTRPRYAVAIVIGIAVLETCFSGLMAMTRSMFPGGMRYSPMLDIICVNAVIIMGPLCLIGAILKPRLIWPALAIQPICQMILMRPYL